MIEMFIFEEKIKTFVLTSDNKKVQWMNVFEPTHEELAWISHTYSLEMKLLESALDENERSRIDDEDGNYLFILRASARQRRQKDQFPFRVLPFGIIFHEKGVLTICAEKIRLFEGPVRLPHSTKLDASLLITHFLMRNVLYFSLDLNELGLMIDVIEDSLGVDSSTKNILKLFNIQRSLMYFLTSIRANEVVLERIFKRKLLLFETEEDRDLLEDVIIENRQAIEVSQVRNQILSGLIEARATVTSNRLNEIMRVLTALTIILNVPTLIASIWGMNVTLPFEKNGIMGFFAVMGILLGSTFLAWGLIRKYSTKGNEVEEKKSHGKALKRSGSKKSWRSWLFFRKNKGPLS